MVRIQRCGRCNQSSNLWADTFLLFYKLKIIGEEEGYKINEGFLSRLKYRIYSWYVDSDYLLFRFMCHRGSFREDINKKCVLCKVADNGMKHVINKMY